MSISLLRSTAAFAALTLVAGAAPLTAQNVSQPGAREFRWSGQPRGDLLRASNISGDVSVTAVDGDRVEVVATRRGTGTEPELRVEVKEHARGITICALYDEDWYCDEDGPDNEGSGWRRRNNDVRSHFDFEVRVPRRMRVIATSVSGDVAVRGTTTELKATSVSGDVQVEGIRATRALDATSVSGDVVARLDAVANGTDLNFRSVSGDVSVTMPKATGLDLSMSTVSGDLESDFPLQLQGRFNRRRIEARINNGGSDLHVSTVSGDVRLAHNNN
jgi:hypothetical protein